MGDRHDYVALDWVKGEIEEVLKQAQYELEAYVEAPEDTARMRFCLTYLHQVRGTLQMVEFYGAALLAEEMEAVAQAMLDSRVHHPAEAREILMQAILQLPNYLDHVKLGRRDLPVVLLPVLNDLRSARGESLLSETSLFQPSIEASSPLTPVQKVQFEDAKFVDVLKKLRQMYQVALLGVLKGKDIENNLAYLQKVTNRVHKLMLDTPLANLWDAAAAVMEGVLSGSVELNSAVKELLKKLEPELKRMVQNGTEAFGSAPEDLLKNLLFYIAKSEGSTPRIQAAKKTFNLDQALPSSEEVDKERQALKGPDKSTMGSVATALIEEITTLKEKLDVLVSSKQADTQQLTELTPGLKQVSDTMAMLGLGTPRKVIQDQFEAIERFIATGKQVTNAELMDIAGALLYVEASLIGLSERYGTDQPAEPQEAQLGEAQHVVLRESKQLIEQIKESIVDFIGSADDFELLAQACQHLESLRGTLIMIPQPQAAAVAQDCAYLLSQQIEVKEKPSNPLLEALAEALSGVEYYLERLDDDDQDSHKVFLEKSREALGRFMTPTMVKEESSQEQNAASESIEEVAEPELLSTEPEIESIELDVVEPVVEEISDDVSSEEPVVEIELESVSLETDADTSFEIDVVPEESAELPAFELDSTEAESLDFELSADESSDGIETLGVNDDVLPATQEEPNAVEPVQETTTAFEDDDDDLIDDEIIEIFLEEAEEVRETLNEFWPQFKANSGDEDALTTSRRAFHTLKGSGRMVNAEQIGETAWAIENMFNRLIDQTIQLSEPFLTIVDYTIDQLSELISAFEHRRATTVDVEAIQNYANRIAQGQDVEPWSLGGAEPQALEVELDDQAVADETESEIDEDVKIDPALLEVFSNEVETHLAVIQSYLDQAQEENFTTPLPDTLQRALHTLKGSAHMAHIQSIADIAAPLEILVKDLRAYHVQVDAEIVHLFMRGKDLIDQGFAQLTQDPFAHVPGTEDLCADIKRLTQQIVENLHTSDDGCSGVQVDPQVISIFLAEGMDILLDAESILEQWQANPEKTELLDAILDELQTLEKGADVADLKPILKLCGALEKAYRTVMTESIQPNDNFIDLIKEAHEGLLAMMDMVAASQTVQPANDLIAALQVSPTSNADDSEEIELSLPTLEVEDSEISLDIEEQPPVLELDDSEFLLEIEESEEPVEVSKPEPVDLAIDLDPELLEIFLEEAQELIDSISESLHEWQQNRDNLLKVAELQRDLHTFKGGARMAEVNAIGDLAHELEDLYEGLHLGRLQANDQLFDLLHLCHDRLGEMVQQVVDHKAPTAAPELIAAIELFLAGESLDLPDTQSPVVIENTPSEELPVLEVESSDSDAITLEVEETNQSEVASLISGDVDEEVIEIFLDEAEELMEDLNTAIQDWRDDPENGAHNEQLQRILHTLKGGARIAGLEQVGNLSHDLETDLQKLQVEGLLPDDTFFKNVATQYGQIADGIDLIQNWFEQSGEHSNVVDHASSSTEVSGEATPSSDNVVTLKTAHADSSANKVVQLRPSAEQPAVEQESTSTGLVSVSANEQNTEVATGTSGPAPTKSQQTEDNKQRRPQPQEMIKVPAELLDGLVNLAGETSISRGRLETHVSEFSFTLDEMDSTLERLKDQLRRLDMETEAQVLFRQERQGPNYDDFDPLEMDRYSQLQQLSRSLVESASDLADLRGTLLDKTRDAETLLLQQSRVNTELQEGLMKTRMVPFARLVPRLRRIVRQVGAELGKQVELRVANAEGEMDRTVLERLISPLEHMLRNAVDHGLENPEVRAKVGKPETGTINLELSRDGGDVVLRLSDDGAGVNLQAVKAKAVERGLMNADSDLPDHEVLQFILQAGFSTAEKVTQLSGRGVGMDVVNSEIKQVGGSVSIDSEQGQGTAFTIRLPFTVSVNRALMARVGDALFAIPLNNIEGIVRVRSSNLHELYQQESPTYSYAGRKYHLDYLGHMLQKDKHPHLDDDSGSMPVVLVRGSVPAALQVDSLMGSREIVVKNLGPQFSTVVGVSGGTILGDGNVVIILDLPSLMRHVNSLEYKQHLAIEEKEEAVLELQAAQVAEDKPTSVLVVDDSVTVRKVTTRLLERNGMEVRTAKDGVDAMSVLQEYRPDIVLLDIEMPRMDGFEVATQMRHDSRLKDIPIIMITSRTGDKHKERALAIGVTDYMGKPFQEEILLKGIATHARKSHQGSAQ